MRTVQHDRVLRDHMRRVQASMQSDVDVRDARTVQIADIAGRFEIIDEAGYLVPRNGRSLTAIVRERMGRD